MRLINVRTLAIHDFVDHHNVPPYAILSHTWGNEEVTFQDWQNAAQASRKAGFDKIRGACLQAQCDGFEWIWIDTNCIDKTSSAELSEAINSMFAWYHNARVCYVYLADAAVDTAPAPMQEEGGDDDDSRANLAGAADQLRNCKWFTRGWTLQELLAPTELIFFSAGWTRIGTRTQLKTPLSQITGVPTDYLCGVKPVWVASIAKRMSWMAKRVTTRVEDMAYSMLGIFDIHMPLLYGEGPRAFLRLQEEILKTTDDHSIFCWEWNREHVDDSWASIFAPCPAVFMNAAEYMATAWDEYAEVVPCSISNAGLSIRLPLVPTMNPDLVFAVLEARHEWQNGTGYDGLWYSYQLCVPLEQGRRIYRRLPLPSRPFPMSMAMATREQDIYISAREKSPEVRRGYVSARHEAERLFVEPGFDAGFLITFASADLPRIDVVYSYDSLLYEKRGIMGFHFDSLQHQVQEAKHDEDRDPFQAAVLKLGFSGGHPAHILLAIRPRISTSRRVRSFSFYCQALPPGEHAHPSLLAMVEEVRSKSLQIACDVDFTTNGHGLAVSMGCTVPYPAGAGQYPVVRLVHVISNDADRTHLLRSNADFAGNLVGPSLLL